MILKKNKSSQKIAFLALTGATGLPVDGLSDVSVDVSLDGVQSAHATTTVTELEATDHPGVYVFAIPKAQTNGDSVVVRPLSATGDVIFVPDVFTFRTGPDWEGDVLGSGFVSSTDALEEIRAYFDSYILPKLRAQASVTEFSGTGWLSDLTEKIRRWTDEPVTSTKYGPTVLLPMIEEGIRKLFSESLLIGDRPILVRYNITIDKDVLEYVLPPNVAQVWRVAQIDSDTGRPTSEILPVGEWDPGIGFRVEGNMLRLTSKQFYSNGDVYEVLYLPNGDVKPYKAKMTLSGTPTDEISGNGLTVTFSGTLANVDGSFDKRLNAYGGCIFRILSVTASDGTAPTTVTDDVEQERSIASSTVDSSGDIALTLVRPLSPLTPGVATELVTLEIVPSFDKAFEDVLAIQVARSMMVSDGNKDRHELLTKEYQEVCRSFRIQVSKAQARTVPRFGGEGGDWDNEDYAIVGGYI